MGRTIGGAREVRLYNEWMRQNPNATKEEHSAFLDGLANDPQNSLRKKQQAEAAETKK